MSVHPLGRRPITAGPRIDDRALSRGSKKSGRRTGVIGAGILVLVTAVSLLGCGSSAKPNANGILSGNWQFTLTPLASSTTFTYTGFLQETGNLVAGSLILGDGCAGVGSVTGTVNGNDFELDIDEFGQALTLTGTLPSPGSGAFYGGQFSTLSGGCNPASTGTWTAFQVPPLNGPFHGTLSSSVDVAGTFTQGANIGASNAALSASIETTGVPPFCSYLTTGTITGVISGTTVSLLFFDANGNQLNSLPDVGTVKRDGSSLTVNYGFSEISNSCTGENGTLQISFP